MVSNYTTSISFPQVDGWSMDPIFVTFWVSVKGTQQCGIELPDIHKFSAG